MSPLAPTGRLDLTACMRLIPIERSRQVSAIRHEGGVQYALYSADGLPSGLLARLVLLSLSEIARHRQIVELAQLPMAVADSTNLWLQVDSKAILDQTKRLASSRWCASKVTKDGFSVENLAMRRLNSKDASGQLSVDFGVEFCEWARSCPQPEPFSVQRLTTSSEVDIYIWLLERVVPHQRVEFSWKELSATFGKHGQEPTMAWGVELSRVISRTEIAVTWEQTDRGICMDARSNRLVIEPAATSV